MSKEMIKTLLLKAEKSSDKLMIAEILKKVELLRGNKTVNK